MRAKTKSIQELKDYAQMWVAKDLQHIYIEGTAGAAKTYTLQEALKDTTRKVFIGNSSPFEFYKTLYEYRQAEHIVLDDIDGLLKKPDGLRLLKELMGSGIMSWNSNRTGDGKEAPKQYEIHSQVCVITNEFGDPNPHTKAVKSRALVIEHVPSAEETIQYAEKNNLITAGMAKQLLNELFPMPLYLNLRDLIIANTLRKNGKDWFKLLEKTTYQ